jgi:hypothetical protein
MLEEGVNTGILKEMQLILIFPRNSAVAFAIQAIQTVGLLRIGDAIPELWTCLLEILYCVLGIKWLQKYSRLKSPDC